MNDVIPSAPKLKNTWLKLNAGYISGKYLPNLALVTKQVEERCFPED